MKTMMHENSLEAYRKGRLVLGERADQIFKIFLRNPDRAYRDSEIRDVFEIHGGPGCHLDMNYVRPRITELVKAELLKEVGSKPDLYTGRMVRLTRLNQDVDLQQELPLE